MMLVIHKNPPNLRNDFLLALVKKVVYKRRTRKLYREEGTKQQHFFFM